MQNSIVATVLDYIKPEKLKIVKGGFWSDTCLPAGGGLPITVEWYHGTYCGTAGEILLY